MTVIAEVPPAGIPSGNRQVRQTGGTGDWDHLFYRTQSIPRLKWPVLKINNNNTNSHFVPEEEVVELLDSIDLRLGDPVLS